MTRENMRFTPKSSIGRLVLLEGLLEFGHDDVCIEAGALDLRGPTRLQRRRRLAPFLELRRRDAVDLVAGFGLELGVAGVFEFCPRAGDLQSPFGGAMVVDNVL